MWNECEMSVDERIHEIAVRASDETKKVMVEQRRKLSFMCMCAGRMKRVEREKCNSVNSKHSSEQRSANSNYNKTEGKRKEIEKRLRHERKLLCRCGIPEANPINLRKGNSLRAQDSEQNELKRDSANNFSSYQFSLKIDSVFDCFLVWLLFVVFFFVALQCALSSMQNEIVSQSSSIFFTRMADYFVGNRSSLQTWNDEKRETKRLLSYSPGAGGIIYL